MARDASEAAPDDSDIICLTPQFAGHLLDGKLV